MSHTYPPLHTATDPLTVLEVDEKTLNGMRSLRPAFDPPETFEDHASQWAPLFLAVLAGFVMAFALSKMGVI